MSSNLYPSTIIAFCNSRESMKQSALKSTIVQFKCTNKDCPYGPKGTKFFKKKIFLQNHMKNIHEEKKFHCTRCEQKFGFDWQLKYHEKFCGQQLTCASCHKCYDKPTSLWMHCKRSGHKLPDGVDFKMRKQKFEDPTTMVLSTTRNLVKSSSGANFILLPIIPTTTTIIPEQLNDISLVNPMIDLLLGQNDNRNKLILPKTILENTFVQDASRHSSTAASKAFESSSSNKPTTIVVEQSSNISTVQNNSLKPTIKLKRSTECQTARKCHRRLSKQIESNSIQTQTLHSSFDLPFMDSGGNGSSSTVYSLENHRNISPINIPTNSNKTSSFTQTFFGCTSTVIDEALFESGKDPFLLKSSMIEDEDESPGKQKSSEELTSLTNNPNHNQLYQNIETQTKECYWDQDLQFSDFSEFIDIETQTIWNYDRTTQTDLFDHPDDDDDWSNFLP